MEQADDRFIKLNQKGDEYFSQHQYRYALYAWYAASKIKPTDVSVLMNIGNTYLKLADLTNALATIRVAVQQAPKAISIRCELIRLLILKGDFPEAKAQLQEISATEPQSTQVAILKGDIFFLEGKPALAETAYRSATADPDNSNIGWLKLAQALIVQGKNESAQKAYEQVESLSPTDATVLVEMHYYWKYRNNSKRSEEFLQKALSVEPRNLTLCWQLAEFYYFEGKYEATQKQIEKIINEFPEKRSAEIFLAEILMAQHKMKEAGVLLKEISQRYEEDSKLALLEGKYHLLSNAPILAIEFFKRALHQAPYLNIARYYTGLAYLAEGRTHLARLSLIEALKWNPNFTDAELLLSDIYYQQQEVDDGMAYVNRTIEREKSNYRAHLILGHMNMAQGQYKNAQSAYGAAQILHPGSISAIYFSAVATENAQAYGTACQRYETLLEKNPKLADVALRYSRVLLKLGETAKAKAYFENAVAKDSKNPYLHYILGEVYISAGLTPEGKRALETAVGIDPTLEIAHEQLITIAEKENDIPGLIKKLERCIQNNPKHVLSYIKLAELQRKEWRVEKAAVTLEKGLFHNSDSPWIANSLAWTYMEQGQQLTKALSLAQKAHEKLPETVAIKDTLGWAYHMKGLHQQAVWILEEAVAIDQSNPMVFFHLGIARNAAGNNNGAEDALKQALALNLPASYKEEAETLIKKMNAPFDEDGCAALPVTPDVFEASDIDKLTEDFSKMLKEMTPESM